MLQEVPPKIYNHSAWFYHSAQICQNRCENSWNGDSGSFWLLCEMCLVEHYIVVQQNAELSNHNIFTYNRFQLLLKKIIVLFHYSLLIICAYNVSELNLNGLRNRVALWFFGLSEFEHHFSLAGFWLKIMNPQFFTNNLCIFPTMLCRNPHKDHGLMHGFGTSVSI